MGHSKKKSTTKTSAGTSKHNLESYGFFDINALKPHPKNYRVHTAEQIRHLAASIKANGFYKNVVATFDGTILAGHGVVEAAKSIGMKEVPTVFLEIEPNDARALKILAGDNLVSRLAEDDDAILSALLKDLSDSGDDLLGTGYDEKDLSLLLKRQIGESEEDGTIDDPGTTDVVVGQVYRVGNHRIMCGDSTSEDDVANLLGGAKPGMMVTDPPYGVEYDPEWRRETTIISGGQVKGKSVRRVGKVVNDNRSSWSESWAQVPHVDVAYVWHSALHSSDVMSSLNAVGLHVRAQLIWAKTTHPISRGHYHWTHEPCWYVVRENKTANWCGDRKQKTTWEIGQDSKYEGGHGTHKPVECMARPMRNHDFDEIYDPFLGSGTTVVAAEQCGRACFGMELHPPYVEICLLRAEKATGETRELEITGEKASRVGKDG